MKDRVSKYPGRALITPEDGSAPFYATITRADEPTQAGNPMGKITFLTDDTAEFAELDPEEATPNDMFRSLTPQIGDIKTTTSIGLSDNWLLCNGAPVFSSTYPDLYKMLATPANVLVQVSTTDTSPFLRVVTDGSSYLAITSSAVYVSSGLAQGFTKKTSSVFSGITFENACYANGTWVVMGKSSTTYYVFTLSSLTASPTKYTAFSVSGTTYSVYDLKYAAGYYVAVVATTGENGLHIYATNNLSGTWTSKTLTSSYRFGPFKPCLEYDSTAKLWIVSSGYYRYMSSNGVWHGQYTATATTPTSTWTQRELNEKNTKSNDVNPRVCMAYTGAYIVRVRQPYVTIAEAPTSTKYIERFNASTLKWELLHTVTLSGTPEVAIHNANDSKLYICDSTTLHKVALGNGAQESLAFEGAVTMNDLVLAGANWLAAGKGSQATSGTQTTAFAVNSAKRAPTISFDAVYSYIRAK